MVAKRVVWPHEVVYAMQGQPPVYSDMSLAMFVNVYLTVLVEEDKDKKPIVLQHLQELMEDSEIYGWRTVQVYYAAWLQQIEQGHALWRNSDKKTKLRRILVWNRPVPSPKSPTNSPVLSHHTTQASVGTGKDGYFSLSSMPGDRACQTFNQRMCKDNTSHPQDLHVCEYCLNTVQ